MKIEFNKATWYSKLLAIIITFGLLPILSFYIGIQYEKFQISKIFLINETIPQTFITKFQAEVIAEPILKNCWNNNQLKIQSFSTRLIINKKDSPTGTAFWNVGGNYTKHDFGLVDHVYGNIPEVRIDAKTGEIIDKHFSEIGDSSNSEECN